MGAYVNPGNEGFARMVSGDYVDKTGLIGLVNSVIGTPNSLVAVTRPRRFGKTFAAESLVAYYSRGCDSRALFEGLDISRDPGFGEHLNAYNVVRLDMTSFRGVPDVAGAVGEVLLRDLGAECTEAVAACYMTGILPIVRYGTQSALSDFGSTRC